MLYYSLKLVSTILNKSKVKDSDLTCEPAQFCIHSLRPLVWLFILLTYVLAKRGQKGDSKWIRANPSPSPLMKTQRNVSDLPMGQQPYNFYLTGRTLRIVSFFQNDTRRWHFECVSYKHKIYFLMNKYFVPIVLCVHVPYQKG